MKLLRYGEPGRERPGLLDPEGTIRDLGAVIEELDGAALGPEGLARLAALDPRELPAVSGEVRLGPCVAGVSKLIGIGLNFRDHAEEAGMAIPAEPIVFMKATSSISGPDDPIRMPRGEVKVDWEAELGVVIGTPASYVEPGEALAHVAGYCVANDVSERRAQLEGTGQWVKGKSADSFAPLGPWLVTPDEVPDPQRLAIFLEVNGEPMQQGSTATMIFPVAELVSYLSRFMTLLPGDVILTGTPPGVGMGRRPPRYLAPGDTVRLGIEGLGEQRQRVVAGTG